MLRHALLGVIVLLTGAAAPGFGQEVKLQFKFKEGEKFWVEEVSQSKENVKLPIIQVNSDKKTTTITSYTIEKVAKDKVVVAMKIESVKVELGAKSEGGLGGGLDKIMEKTQGSTFTVTLTPDGQVKKFEGLNEVIKRLAQGNDDSAKAFKELITEEAFIIGVEQVFGFVPDKAVKKGDTWKREAKFSLGPLGGFKTTNTYTYNGKVEKGDEISLTQSMKYELPKGEGIGGVLKVVGGDLKGDKAKVTYVFDADKGRLVSATASMRVGGTLKANFAGMEVELELSVESSSTSRVHSKNPLKE